ncbi:MAG: DUF3592 domain-containing protein [Candidatus Brocadiia bacterium]
MKLSKRNGYRVGIFTLTKSLFGFGPVLMERQLAVMLPSGDYRVLLAYDADPLLLFGLSGSGERNILLVMGVGLFVGSAVIFFLSIRKVFRALESPRWETTKGRIVESRTVATTPASGGGGWKPMGPTRHIKIKYEYSVEDRNYIGEKHSFGDYLPINKQLAEEIVEYYPEAKEVEVFYKPFKPELSVLKPGLNRKTLLIPLIGFLPLLFGILFILLGYGVIGN